MKIITTSLSVQFSDWNVQYWESDYMARQNNLSSSKLRCFQMCLHRTDLYRYSSFLVLWNYCQPLFSKDRCLWQIGEDLHEPNSTMEARHLKKKKILHKAHLHCSVSKYFSKSVSRSLNSFEEMPMWSFSQLYVSLFKADRGTEEASSASPSTPGLCLLLKGFQQTTVLLSSCFLFHHHKTPAVRSSSHLASD